MTRVIEELELDHRNMRQLLAVIEDEADAYLQGRSPDFDLLRLILDYTVNYPNIAHHPREDAVYEMLLRRDPVGAAGVGNLLKEHRQLSKLTNRLAAAVGNAARDVEMPRDWLDNLIRDYLVRNRAHMQAEDQQFFPRALAALTDEDWAEVDAKLRRLFDPLFGGQVAQEYQRLYQRIMALHV